ncbi:hypothetical protein SDRG_00280 [Saprolegnia diclina VS20]|uniref:Uncharacterized protein n=1 Tax=Saprolegnia diclina (strain VS20) TaxID=1156394 RepID=T0R7V9_SAPDV|nr:hypothetical protein SDRG_00280 [Saprolegnia diclina VS20]EQC42550.1 hypothetical protein SDRG_00280 [Saprolegnia diclina VS20]|eukprot:XP_008603973.1 hypothetical protein SDRG_00280 [Saprolegnia diclina VS20]
MRALRPTSLVLLALLRRLLADDHASNWCAGFDEVVLTFDGPSPESRVGGSRLSPNMTFNSSVLEDAYAFYQVCIARHTHEHAIEVDVVAVTGDTTLFLSAENPLPQRGHSSWIAQQRGNDHVSLPTYLPEFPRDGPRMALYIGVLGAAPGVSNFTLTVAIKDLPENADVRSRQEYYDKSRRVLLETRRLRRRGA